MDAIFLGLQDSFGLPTFLVRLIRIGLIIILSFIVLNIGKSLIKKIAERTKYESGRLKTLNSLLYSVFRVLVIFFALSLALDVFGINTASLLTAAGIGGVALALGSQTLVSDLLAGALLQLENSVNIGDFVQIGQVIGTVTSIGLRKMTVHAYKGMDYLIPNSEIKILANYGKGPMQSDIDIEIPNKTDPKKARELVDKICSRGRDEVGKLFLEAPYFVGIENLSVLTFRIRIGVKSDMANFWAASRRLRQISLEAMWDLGINKEEEKDCQKAVAISEDI